MEALQQEVMRPNPQRPPRRDHRRFSLRSHSPASLDPVRRQTWLIALYRRAQWLDPEEDDGWPLLSNQLRRHKDENLTKVKHLAAALIVEALQCLSGKPVYEQTSTRYYWTYVRRDQNEAARWLTSTHRTVCSFRWCAWVLGLCVPKFILTLKALPASRLRRALNSKVPEYNHTAYDLAAAKNNVREFPLCETYVRRILSIYTSIPKE